MQEGGDSYQAARDCADRLAFDFLWEAAGGICIVFILSLLVVAAIFRHKDEEIAT